MNKSSLHDPHSFFSLPRLRSFHKSAKYRLICLILLTAAAAGLTYSAIAASGREIKLAEFKGEHKGPFQIRFSKQEMEAIAKDATPTKTLSSANAAMEITPMPDGGGLGKFRHRCPPGCSELGVGSAWGPFSAKYGARFGFAKPGDGRVGYTPGPDEPVVIVSCDCPLPEIPEREPAPNTRPKCELAWVRIGGSIVFRPRCVNRSCAQTCRLVIGRQPNGLVLLGCDCR